MATSELAAAGVSIVPHGNLAGYRGIWFFHRGSRLVVSAPEPWVSHLRVAFSDALPALPSLAELSRVIGSAADRFIGPVFHGATDASTFRPRYSPETRPLQDSDAESLLAFREACGPSDWADSGLDEAPLYRVVRVENGAIDAMAGFRPWSRTAGDPCVLTHPRRRRMGLAASVVSAVVASALADGHVLLYQTLEANPPAVRLALSLGYARYAQHLAVRLNADEPPP